MIFKLVALCLFGQLLASVESLTLEEVLTEVTPKVDALKDEVINTMVHQEERLDLIDDAPRQVREELSRELRLLEERIKMTKSEHRLMRRDIDVCVKQEKGALKSINLKEFEQCKGRGLYEAARVLQKFPRIKRKVSRIIPDCVTIYYLHPDDCKICVEKDIMIIKMEVENLRKEMEEALGGVDEDFVRNCVEEKKMGIDALLLEVETNIDDCVGRAALSQTTNNVL